MAVVGGFLLLLLLLLQQESRVMTFFVTNAEKELLYFSGFGHQRYLPEVASLCASIDASLLEDGDDITPIYEDLDINGVGVWLNQLPREECPRQFKQRCCGNYAFKKSDWFSGQRLEVQKRSCWEEGFTLCRVNNDINNLVATLYNLQFRNEKLQEFIAQREESSKEIARLESADSSTAAAGESLILTLGMEVQSPKLKIHETHASLEKTKAKAAEAQESLDFSFEEKQEKVESRITQTSDSLRTHASVARRLEKRVAVAATAFKSAVEGSSFAVELAYANVDELLMEGEADFANRVEEEEVRVADAGREQLAAITASLARQDVAGLRSKALEAVSNVTLGDASAWEAQLEEWKQQASASAALVTSDWKRITALFESLAFFLDSDDDVPTLRLTLQGMRHATATSFRTTCVTLLSLLAILVSANFVFLYRRTRVTASSFQRLSEEL